MIIAVPLIFSSAGLAIQQFVDRMFLAWYSAEAIAATMPAGILNFTIINLFVGTAGYTGTFVAQYFGASRNDRIGPIMWQGMYIAVFAAVVHFLLIPLAVPIFHFVGHDPEVQRLEIVYFQVICLGAGPNVAIAVLSGFFLGRGNTRPVMTIGIMGNLLNVILNYLLIFGNWGFPELGVKGAAIATVVSSYLAFLAYWVLIFNTRHEEGYRVLSGWRPNAKLFLRLLRFGLPNGFQFFVVYLGISLFILFVGRLGMLELAATNIAFNINMLAFMPMIGFAMAIMIKVGHYQGQERPDLSEYSVYSGFHLTGIYMVAIAAAYVLLPNMFLWPFAIYADADTFTPIKKLTVVLLRFVAVYSLFDTLSIVFSSGIKGAGDTKFVMFMNVGLTVVLLAVPCYVVVDLLGMGIYAAWTVVTIYICASSCAFLLRFLHGRWKTMSVIEIDLTAIEETVLAE
ncbi:MAG: MATE family efflux transporter [Proteobacteria bacterium]|nr:MATE family efflux transporter [Pseudomonadota bacterium]